MRQRVSATLRKLIRQRAEQRCEYCLIHEDDVILPHQPDHIIARKHGGKTTADNLAWACALCNSFKGSDIASVDVQTGRVVPLLNPRVDTWSKHFRLEAGHIIPLTPRGRATEYLLQFNRPDLVQLRRMLAAAGRYREKT